MSSIKSGARLLIVEDDEHLGRALARSCRRCCPTHVVGSVREALGVLAARFSLAGAIIDVDLPDGCGTDLLQPLRAAYGAVPVLVLSAHNDAQFINAAQLHEASYGVKPLGDEHMRAFLRRLGPGTLSAPFDVTQALASFAVAHSLTPAEVRIVELSVRGVERSDLHVQLGVSPNTLKSQIKRLLKKCEGPDSLAEVVRAVLHRASTSPPAERGAAVDTTKAWTWSPTSPFLD